MTKKEQKTNFRQVLNTFWKKGGFMISKILVPTDGSKAARKSVEYAAGFAKQTGAAVTVMTVIDKSSLVPLSISGAATPTHLIEPVEDYLRQAAEAYIAEAEGICARNKVPAKRIIRTGHPVEEIAREAERSKFDLIIIGSRGKSALKAAVLGSVAFGIINKETKVPVLVVRK
jgi:nucleotide-binding universal stress UspA family protein